MADADPSLPVRATNNSLKRKAIIEEDEEAVDQPRKLPAIGATRPNRPLQPSRTATNLNTSRGATGVALPKPLTKPKAPALTRSTRGTSAPPVSSKPLSRPTAPSRTTAGRVVSGSGPVRSTGGRPSDDKRFQELQTQLTSIEEARAADAARLAADMEAERSKVAELQANHLALSRELATAKSQELNQRRELVHASDEIENLKKKHSMEVMDLEMDVKKRDRELREVNEDLRICRADLERERETVSSLKNTITHQSTAHLTITTQNNALRHSRQLCISELTLKLETAQKQVDDMKKEAMESELVRRKLHNMVQELKGNIRVFCRVRPVLPSDLTTYAGSLSSPGSSTSSASGGSIDFDKAKEELQASLSYPDQRDHKEIVVSSSSSSATGQERKEIYNFAFDRVFEPDSTQAEVFEEISQLAQSCVDGYNVCIFAYGQTGSGKSFTMEGGASESSSGMIPRAVEQMFRVAEDMKTRGWEYKMEGQFLEIYNETVNDLLGKGEFDKKKHEIKHDPKTGSTRVTDVEVVQLSSPSQVRSLLAIAQSRRSMAATLMNERSSRSHSVFTLRISGVNVGIDDCPGTGEKCEGSLNLVDLAGSERLNVSFANGADKERVKETQSINKSLSALGDVIAALGEKGEKGGDKHIPYRNSKLTYLLQNSLSGNSKTLMVLNLSPLAAHLQESLTSLRFATKVNNTTIGTAKKQTRVS
ncbi:kinesin-domain-containing protein [Gymnopilus junonius]|uniref:Kinesin-like protein n=1 Tax=Gymnopilus junonius TaxID=109634 RepID=A0A9P5NFL8_GYMJU|nr:kinesin-domain-containing protein [Gymnopilus junonius]